MIDIYIAITLHVVYIYINFIHISLKISDYLQQYIK